MIVFILAVPNKGRLRKPCLDLLEKAGFELENKDSRCLSTKIRNEDILVTFLRAKDIPKYVSQGLLNLGLTGYDLILESREKVIELLDLKFGYCKLIVAVPKENPSLTSGMKIATAFPILASMYFSKKRDTCRYLCCKWGC